MRARSCLTLHNRNNAHECQGELDEYALSVWVQLRAREKPRQEARATRFLVRQNLTHPLSPFYLLFPCSMGAKSLLNAHPKKVLGSKGARRCRVCGE